MGGTIAKLSDKGLTTLFVDVCDAQPTRYASRGARQRQAAEAARIVGVARLTLDFRVRLDLFIESKPAIIAPGQPGCERCEETRALLEDVASLSNQITLTVYDVRAESDLTRFRRCTFVER